MNSKGITMTDAEHVEVFLEPAMQLIAEERADTIGPAFVKWLCTGEKPVLADEDDELCWNLVMMRTELLFNPKASVSDFIRESHDEEAG